MFTENGKKGIRESKLYGMDDFYDPYIGNFGFTENELFENMNKIIMWLEDHDEYYLKYESGYELNKCWWLTFDF